MKKILIFNLLLFMSVLLIGSSKVEVEAKPELLYDFACNSPRFMYARYDDGELRPLECEFRTLQSQLYLDEIENFEVSLRIVDSNGNLRQVFDTFETDFERESAVLSDGLITYNVSTITDVSIVNFKVEVSGEVESIRGVYNNTKSTNLSEGNDWYYDELNNVVVLNTFNGNYSVNDEIYIWITKYDSTTYIYEYENTGLSSYLMFLNDGTQDIEDIDTEFIYQFVVDGEIIYSGMIALPVIYNADQYTINHSIGFGNMYFDRTSVYITSSDDLEKITYFNGDYLLLHYEKDPNIIETLYIRFYDISTGTIVESLDTEDIFFYQIGNDNERQKSFIPLSLNGNYISGLNVSGTNYVNDTPNNIESFSLNEGVYMITLENSSGDLIDYSDNLLIIVEDDNADNYSLFIAGENININTSQKVLFEKLEFGDDYFTTIEAKDLAVNYDYDTAIDKSPSNTIISYKPLETLELGDVIAFRWKLEPSSLPKGLDTSEFIMVFTEEYTIVDVLETEDQIYNLASYYGLDDSRSLLFLSVGLIILVNVVLVFVLATFEVRGYIIYAIVNAGILLLEYSLGWLPVWVGLIVGIIILLSLLFLFSRRGDES